MRQSILWRSLGGLATALVLAWPAAGDWLVTVDGKLIETRGPWTIEAQTLSYTDLQGEPQTLDLAQVDLEGSEETTALRAGKPYVPKEKETPEAAAPLVRPGYGRDGSEEPKIILYTGALCRQCSDARELLRKLDVAYVEKDITSNRKHRKEYQKKAGHGGGLPIVDIDGTVIYFYNRAKIRKKIREFVDEQAAAAKPDGESGG